MSVTTARKVKVKKTIQRELNSRAIEPEKDFEQNFATEPRKAQNKKEYLIFNEVIIVFHLNFSESGGLAIFTNFCL
jgi:hypothetical protein